MTSNIPVPSLSTQGWVIDDINKMDILLAHYFLSDYNQTQLYRNRISSLTRMIQKHGQQADRIVNDLKQELQQYLGSYYDRVEVTVITNESVNINPSIKFELKVSIKVIDSSINSQYERLIKTQDSKLSEIVRINNIG